METSAALPPPPKWVLDLNSPPSGKPKSPSLPDPPGYTAATTKKQLAAAKQTARKPPTSAEMDTLKIKKAWEIALAPIKQLPMTGIMMYMSGNGLQIFSIMMVWMAFKNPIMGLLNTNAAFARYESEGTRAQMLQIKAVFVAMQLLALALGVWKVNAMGLLPTTRSDWLAWETARQPLETAVPILK